MLTNSQKTAIAYAESVAQEQSELCTENLLVESKLTLIQLEQIYQKIANRTEVCIHFHPDRIGKNGKTVIASLIESGNYKNQFETGISNGGLDLLIDGKRQLWESRLFGNSYTDKVFAERPKYGAFNLMQNSDGPSPRFGSCYFRLQPKVNERCTFTYLDSYFEPESIGTTTHFSPILLEMYREVRKNQSLFGKENLNSSSLSAHLELKKYNLIAHSSNFGKTLDDYVEAQIHGEINLKEDVKALVADANFQNTLVENQLESLCEKFHIELDWHGGLSISPDSIPANFRAGEAFQIAEKVASNGEITAYLIGLAGQSAIQSYEKWKAFGTPAEIQQKLKYLWHALVAFS
jgi:hypothetical protein